MAKPIRREAAVAPGAPARKPARATDGATPAVPAVGAGPGKMGRSSVWFRAFNLIAALPNLATLAAFVVVWQVISSVVLPRFDPYAAVLMPAPSMVAATAVRMISSGDLVFHTLASLAREGTAFAIALSGVPIGLVMGWFPRVRRQLDPLVEILRPIPPLAWIPLSILWFGIGDQQNEFIIFLGMFFPILINTIDGVRSVDPILVRAARSLGATEFRVVTRVVLRAALPQIVTGLRIGLGFGWMALVAAELIGASSGLGFMINDARSVLRTDIIVVGMATIGIVGLLIDRILRTLARAFLPWSASNKG